jgi:hypothetical protein
LIHVERLSASTLLAATLAGLVGVVGMWEAASYDFGSPRQIGPAVFPFGLSLILFLTAIGCILEGLSGRAESEGALNTAPIGVLLGVLGGPLAFALLVGSVGLVPAIIACVIIASLAEGSLKPLTVLLLAGGMSVVCSLVFVSLLNLPIDIVAW